MLSAEIAQIVRRYLDRAIPVEHLEEWLIPRELDIMEHTDSADDELLGAFQLGMADVRAGTITEDEFRSDLAIHLESASVLIGRSSTVPSQPHTPLFATTDIRPTWREYAMV